MNLKKLSKDAEAGLHDLFHFGSFFWGLDLEEKPHREMCWTIEQVELNPNKPYSMLVVPRGTYKTSIARATVVWWQLRQLYLYNNPYYRVVLTSSSLKLGRASLRTIEWLLMCRPVLAEAYGQLWRARSRSQPGSHLDDGLVLAPRLDAGETAGVSEPSFWVGSQKAIQTGLHADAAFVDDLNNKENVQTDHQRKKTQDYWDLLFPLLGGKDNTPPKIIMTATPWHDDDVRGMILRKERERFAEDPDYPSPWTVMHKGAINEDGTPLFPSKYPLETLARIKRDINNPSEYAANYDCDPVGEKGSIASADEIVFKDPGEFPALRDGRITVDPNQHKDAMELGCYAAIIVAAYDRFAKMYVQDARGSREWDTNDLINALFEIKARYPSYPVFMEDSHMAHFAHAVGMEEARRSAEQGQRVRLGITYIPTDPKASKYDRWMRLKPRFENRDIYFSRDIPVTIKQEIKEELIRGQVARFKDFLDALAAAETGVMPRIARDGQPIPIKADGTPQMSQMPPPFKFKFADAFKGLRKVM